MTDAVLYTVAEPHIALVTLNRPEARNAVNGAVAAGLEAALLRSEADPGVRVVILTGAGPHAFCAGADLKEVAAGRVATLATERGGFGGLVRAPRSKCWIAAAQGHALAGGLELLLACDLAVGAESATFGLPEVKRSLVAAAGGVFRLPRALPKAIALRMIATGEPIDAAMAQLAADLRLDRPELLDVRIEVALAALQVGDVQAKKQLDELKAKKAAQQQGQKTM